MKGKILAAITVLCLVSLPALADDILTPPWDRGADGTTFARWEFSTPDPNPIPDEEINPYGPAEASVWTGVGQGWFDMWGGRQGVWPLSGAAEIMIPNRPEPYPWKDIWVQITWAAQVPGAVPLPGELVWGGIAELVQEQPLEPTMELPPVGETWMHSTYLIHLEPNPDHEIIRIDGSIMIDELVIDTICIPEPMTLGMLALGALALRRRRA
jgi:hypothetical protein